MSNAFEKDEYVGEKIEGLQIGNEKASGKEFEDCRFDKCSLVDTHLVNCKFINCKFEGCVLSAVVPTDCRFSGVGFANCKVIGVDWSRARSVEDVGFTECTLDFSNFTGLKLPGLKMTNCQAKEADFIETDLSESDLSGTDFEKSTFAKTNLYKADLRRAGNYYIDPRTNNIKGAKFTLPEALSLLDSFGISID